MAIYRLYCISAKEHKGSIGTLNYNTPTQKETQKKNISYPEQYF